MNKLTCVRFEIQKLIFLITPSVGMYMERLRKI